MNRRTLLLGLCLTLLGCGYHLAGRGAFLPERIKVIGVPSFETAVPRSGLSEALTEAVTNELVSRGGYRIVPTTRGADAVLLGTITGFVSTPVAVDEGGIQTRSMLTITAGVTLRDLKDSSVLYENPMFHFRSEVELGANEQDFFDPESEAIESIGREFARSLVATIVEGF